MNTTTPLPPLPALNRRDFLALLAAAGAAVPLATSSALAQAPGADASATAARSPAPAGPRTLHVFAKPLQWLSYEATAELVAETGLGGIDYAVRPGGHVLPEKAVDDLPRAVEAARKAGLEVEMITTGIVNAQDKHTEPLLRTAAKLGVKYYRLGSFNYDPKLGILESLERHRATVKELAALNRSLGIHGCFQNHAGTRVGAPLWDLYHLVHDVDPRWIGVQYDIRHATVEGGQAWPLALRLLAPWIRCTDIKDFRWEQSPGRAVIQQVPLGEGIVPFDAYFKLVRELNIGGPISLHLEYPPFERDRRQLGETEKRAEFLAGMKKDVAALKGWLAQHRLA